MLFTQNRYYIDCWLDVYYINCILSECVCCSGKTVWGQNVTTW